MQPLQDDLTRGCPEKIDPLSVRKVRADDADLLRLPRNQTRKVARFQRMSKSMRNPSIRPNGSRIASISRAFD